MISKYEYGTIVFMIGSDYDEFEEILDEHGEEAAMSHLQQWNYGEGYTDVCDEMPGTNWHEHTWHSLGYPDLFMVWSSQYQYVGLFERIQK